MGGQGSKAGGLGYAEEIAPTIKSVMSGGNTVPDVVYAINDKATRYKGGGDTRKNDGAGNGFGIQTDGKMYTLDTVCNHAMCFVQQRIGQYAQDTIASTEMARDYKSAKDLVVKSAKSPRKYIIRRLTPLECCRLQGFPDGWGDIQRLETMTDADAEFWDDVRRTYAGAMGKQYRQFKDKDALVKWYNKLHTDSAEYKMWGNGIALPCAVYVMQGISDTRMSGRSDD